MTGNKTNGARGARRTKSTILPRRDRATRKRPTHLLLELGGDLLGLGWGLHDGEHGSRCDHGGVAGEGSARLLGFREGRGRREGRKASRVRACQPRARSPSSTAVGRERGGGSYLGLSLLRVGGPRDDDSARLPVAGHSGRCWSGHAYGRHGSRYRFAVRGECARKVGLGSVGNSFLSTTSRSHPSIIG